MFGAAAGWLAFNGRCPHAAAAEHVGEEGTNVRETLRAAEEDEEDGVERMPRGSSAAVRLCQGDGGDQRELALVTCQTPPILAS